MTMLSVKHPYCMKNQNCEIHGSAIPSSHKLELSLLEELSALQQVNFTSGYSKMSKQCGSLQIPDKHIFDQSVKYRTITRWSILELTDG